MCCGGGLLPSTSAAPPVNYTANPVGGKARTCAGADECTWAGDEPAAEPVLCVSSLPCFAAAAIRCGAATRKSVHHAESAAVVQRGTLHTQP